MASRNTIPSNAIVRDILLQPQPYEIPNFIKIGKRNAFIVRHRMNGIQNNRRKHKRKSIYLDYKSIVMIIIVDIK
jgi:hypothetical protein